MPASRLSSSSRTLTAQIAIDTHASIAFGERIHTIEPGPLTADSVLPGFIDLQINGGYGIDVMSASAEDLLRLSEHLAREGVVAWLPTVITSPLEKVERCEAIIAEAKAVQREMDRAEQSGSQQPVTAAILGMHLEGPFISPQRLGAHPPLTLTPQADALERVLALKTLKLITLAPELDGAIAAIRRLVARGIAVSLGHSNATYAEAMAGVAAGATMFTHVFNAMRPLHHREPGIVGAALTPTTAHAAIIPDGIHLHPATCGVVYRARGAENVVITTDRVSVSQTRGSATLFGDARHHFSVSDGAARLTDGTLAGSIITMLDGMRFMLCNPVFGPGCSQFAYAQMASTSPAAILGLPDRGLIVRDARADFILLDHALELKAAFIGGREVV